MRFSLIDVIHTLREFFLILITWTDSQTVLGGATNCQNLIKTGKLKSEWHFSFLQQQIRKTLPLFSTVYVKRFIVLNQLTTHVLAYLSTTGITSHLSWKQIAPNTEPLCSKKKKKQTAQIGSNRLRPNCAVEMLSFPGKISRHEKSKEPAPFETINKLIGQLSLFQVKVALPQLSSG